MIKKIIKRLLGINTPAPQVNPLEDLRQNGNLIIGENCNIENFRIFKYTLDKEFCNVEVGKDCFLENNIMLYGTKSKVKIGDRVYLGPNTNINCREAIEIGDDVMFSWGCTIMDTNAHSLFSSERLNDVVNWKKGWEYKDWSVVESKKIIIGNKCWIGFNSIIVKGVVLGEGCIVASGSVVTKSFEPYSVIGGNPATFIKKTT